MKTFISLMTSVLCLLLSSIGFAQGKLVAVSIGLKGFSVPNMYFFSDLNDYKKYNNLGAIPDGGSVKTAISDSTNMFGLNFCGLSNENTFAAFQKDAGGKVDFSGWKAGGEGLWVHIDNRVSPVAIVVGPSDILASVYGFNLQNLCFFQDSMDPYRYLLKEFDLTDAKTVYQLQQDDFSKGVIYKDYESSGKPSSADRLTIDAKTGVAELTYGFATGDIFESCFVRLPVNVANSRYIFMDVEGDKSKNNFFVILHDTSGEQHLIIKTCLLWQGWQKVGISLSTYLESPKKMERLIIHWGGDENQKIDFPVKAIDIGLAKHKAKAKDSGQLRFRNVRFTE